LNILLHIKAQMISGNSLKW